MKTRWAPSLWAFFYLRPLVPLPVRNRVLVALHGAPLGNLATPTGLAENLPDMAGVVADAKLASDHSGNAFQRPKIVGIAVGCGTLQENVPQTWQSRTAEFGWPTWDWARSECRLPTGLVGIAPGRHRRDGCIHSPRNLAQRQTQIQILHGAAPSASQEFWGAVGSHVPYIDIPVRLLWQNAIRGTLSQNSLRLQKRCF